MNEKFTLIVESYLVPSIPSDIFKIICKYIKKELNVNVKLKFITTSSGPKINDKITADIMFMCTPPFYWLKDSNKNIELINWAFVFDDPRNNDLPLYFSDVFVKNDNIKINKLKDIEGKKWAYNDTESLSGYFCIKNYWDKINLVCSGSHIESIKYINNGKVDVSGIDSNALLFLEHNLKKIATIGPHPIQPIVINTNSKFYNSLKKIFAVINYDIETMKNLKKFKIKKFGYVDDTFYFQKYHIRDIINVNI
tara:strand:+ start:25482 stop:26237 length:756 start_codon:yes stop_codon:yes gene_type:complete